MNSPRPYLCRFVSLPLLVALVATVGCSSAPTEIDNGPTYPALVQSSVIDVQVVRDETKITFTNTTAAPLSAGRLWINQWYSREFEGLGVGRTVTLDLGEFRDRYGAKFRSGGFFATEFADRLVQMQLYADDALTGMVVIRPIE